MTLATIEGAEGLKWKMGFDALRMLSLTLSTGNEENLGWKLGFVTPPTPFQGPNYKLLFHIAHASEMFCEGITFGYCMR